MRRPRYRLLFDWEPFERALREGAARRNWTDEQLEVALARDHLCTIEVDDIEAHLDWHERQGFAMVKPGTSVA